MGIGLGWRGGTKHGGWGGAETKGLEVLALVHLNVLVKVLLSRWYEAGV